MVSNCFYDFLTASQNTETLLQYSVNYRNFYLVTHGVVKIKLIPPKSARYLYPIEDYENFEFRSPLNPWAIQRQYKADYDKIKTLEIELTPGKIIYIPAYWWYSIKFMEPVSSVCVFKYRTYMNTVAILPKLCMKTLQRQNTKRETVKKVRFQKNETAKIMVENDKERGKGVQIPKLPHIISPVLANVESSRLDLNSNALEGTDYMQNSEESKEVDAVTLSLIDVAD
jgi:hypothetical protein